MKPCYLHPTNALALLPQYPHVACFSRLPSPPTHPAGFGDSGGQQGLYINIKTLDPHHIMVSSSYAESAQRGPILFKP
jgi:hypothetical protein